MDSNFINMIMGMMFGWFRDQWQSSGALAIESAMKMLMTSPWPALDSGWFKALWNNYFGMCVIIVIVLAIPRLVAFGLNLRSGGRLGEVVIDIGKMMLIGTAMLIGLRYAMEFVDIAAKMLFSATTGGADPNNWYQSLIRTSHVLDLWGGLFLAAIGMISGVLLWMETLLVQNAMYAFALLYMTAFAFKRWRLGGWLLQGAHAGLIVTLCVKVFALLWLGPWSVVLANIPATDATNGVLSIFVVFVAAWLPFGAFMGLLVHRIKVDGRVRTEGKQERDEKYDRMLDQNHLSSKYAGTLARGASRTKEFAGKTAGVAGVALATLALERGGNWLAGKALVAGQPQAAALLKVGSKAAAFLGNKTISKRPEAARWVNHGHRAIDGVQKFHNRRPGDRGNSSSP